MSISSLRIANISLPQSIRLPEIAISWKAVAAAGALSLIALSVTYIMEVSQLTKSEYLLNASANQLQQLGQQNRNLEVSLAENTFLQHILQQAAAMNFVVDSNVQYIQASDNAFALAKKN
jgi:hypothetical protein